MTRDRRMIVCALLAVSFAGLTSCGGPADEKQPAMSAVEADTLLQSYAKDRADTRDWLKTSPTSYLATVQRRDFGEQSSLTVGGAPESDVRIEDPGVKPHHLRVTVVGVSFRVETLDK